MKDFRILKFIDRFKFIYERFGVDYEVMRRILQIKLIMDSRRTFTIMENYKNSDPDKEENMFKKYLFSYGITGIFIMIFMFLPFPVFLKMNLAFGMIIFMIMATMVSDFSSVLLDIRDKNILLSRPIDSNTVNAAKMTHIFIYLFTITVVIAGPSVLAAVYKYGIVFSVIFICELILVSGFVMFFTSLLYFFILSIFDGEKLKDIINYFQIVLSIFMLISYQLIGRIFDITKLNITFSPKWWHYLIPSTWFAAPLGMVTEGYAGGKYMYFALTGVIIPVLVFIIYFRFIIPYFERNLQKLSNNNSKKSESIEKKGRRYKNFAGVFCRNKPENIFFRFTQNMISNERKLKLKLYPNLAFSAVLPFIILLGMIRDVKSFSEAAKIISEGTYIFSLYTSITILSTTIIMIYSSENFRGAWIYRTLPLESPNAALRGAFKGFIMKFITPIYVFVSLGLLLICGVKIIPDIVLGFFSMIFLMLFFFRMAKKSLPFSRDFQYTQSDNTGSTITLFLIAGALGVAHYFIYKMGQLPVIAAIGVLLVIIIIFWVNSFKIGWKNIV